MSEKDQHIYKDRYMLRLPDGMRQRIKQVASNNGRSMNAEIVATLEKAYPPKTIDVNALSELLGTLIDLHPSDGQTAYNQHLEYIEALNALLSNTEQPWKVESGWDGRVIFSPYEKSDEKGSPPKHALETKEG
jgi:plasmid stability protein